MRRGGRWTRWAVLAGLAVLVGLGLPGPGGAATEVGDWHVEGDVGVGGQLSFGERGSSKYNEYRDTDNGIIGDFTLRGEKTKGNPYFLDLRGENVSREDQAYEGSLGWTGLFRLEGGWNRTPHVLSNTARTIFSQSGDALRLPAAVRSAIARDTQTLGACPVGVVLWNCPVEYASSTPAMAAAQRAFIANTIEGLARPVELGFNTDVGLLDLILTPTEAFRVDAGYSQNRKVGYRPIGTVIGSPGGAVTEIAVPIENTTHEMKLGAEYAKSGYAFQFGYLGSIFRNEYTGYTWDNPGYFGTDNGNFVTGGGATRAVRVSQDRLGAPPDNIAHTFSATGSAALPFRSRLSGTLAYSFLRQDEAFQINTLNSGAGVVQTNADDAGRTSADAKTDLLLGNFLLTSRPIRNVTATARYRFFEHQNDMPLHTFSNSFPEGLAVQTHTSKEERFQKQNAGLDLGWRPIRWASLKVGYEYERYNRGDMNTRATNEHIGKLSADLTPVSWLLTRLSYSHGDREMKGEHVNVAAEFPGLRKFNQADRVRDRVDLFLNLTRWETVSPSLSFGYARDDYNATDFGLTKNDYYTLGAGLAWTPLGWLQLSTDYAYELYRFTQRSRYRAPGVDTPANDWESKNKDEYHTLNLGATADLIPKKLDLSLGYSIALGFTVVDSKNLGAHTAGASSLATDRDRVSNILQTIRLMARYHFTEKFQARLGYTFERYTERDFARDPMQPWMGNVDTSTAGTQSVFLGATQPSYESHTVGFSLRYGF